MVGHHFCCELVKRGLHKVYEISIFGEEPTLAYDRVHLSEHFYGRSFNDLILATSEWYDEHGIALQTKCQIVRLDGREKCVISEDGSKYFYDELVLATGSTPFIPPVEGLEKDSDLDVLTYRSFSDLVRIRNAASDAKRVAVMGGGLLGLEAARACQELGLNTYVLEMAEYLMPKQLDQGAARALGDIIDKMDIHLLCSRHTEKVWKRDSETIIEFKDGDHLAVDMIIVAAGIVPRDDVARTGNIECNPRGGVVINDALETSLPNVYAIGECAHHQGKVYGLVAPGYKMSSQLALRLGGDKTAVFEGMDHSTRLKLMGTDVVSIGQPLQPGEVLTYKKDDIYRRLTLRDNVILGVVAIGPWEDLPSLQKRLEGQEELDRHSLRSFRKTGTLPQDHAADSVLSWPDSTTICNCMNINKGQIVAACKAGAESVADIGSATGAGMVCGSCKIQLAQFIGQEDAHEYQDKSTKWVGVASVLALMTMLLFVLVPGMAHAQSVQDPNYGWQVIWRDSFWKQVTGYSSLALMSFSLLFILRKRWHRFQWGNFQMWRVSHILFVILIYAALFAHTGWRMGHNINMALMLNFLLTSATGLGIGWSVYQESKADSKARKWFKSLYWVHMVSFWPLPILLFFHILKFYVY